MVRPGRITRLGFGVRGCGCCGTRVSAAVVGRAEAALQRVGPLDSRGADGRPAGLGAGADELHEGRRAGRGARRAVRCAAARVPDPHPSECSSAGAAVGSGPGQAPPGPCGQRPRAATWLVHLVRGGSGTGPGLLGCFLEGNGTPGFGRRAEKGVGSGAGGSRLGQVWDQEGE